MRTLYPLGIFYIALILSSCTTTPATTEQDTTTHHTIVSHRDPVTVSMINEKPTRPYKVVGKASVSKFNPVGIRRQEATIRDLMREYAANANGDALIDIKNHDNVISGTIIAYDEGLA